MNRMLRVLCSILVVLPLLYEAQAPAPNEKVPIIEGGAGFISHWTRRQMRSPHWSEPLSLLHVGSCRRGAPV